MDESVEEFSTPRVDADGDGLKKSVRKRIPYPSARKFSTKSVKDETALLKIQSALDDLQRRPKVHDCLKKAQTMAEITPSKCRIKKRNPKVASTPLNLAKIHSDRTADEEVPQYATPRRTPPMITTTAVPIPCPRMKAECYVYRRLLLLCWRRRSALTRALEEQCVRQKDQIAQLELQVDVLKSLRMSESDKRKEALNECQQIRKACEALKMENSQLVEELTRAKDDLEDTKEKLELTKTDLKRSSEQLIKVQNMLKKKKEERMDLASKLTDQEREIFSQNGIISRLEETLKTTTLNVLNSESNLKIKESRLEETLENLQNEIDLNASLKEEILDLQLQKTQIENQSQILEDEINQIAESCQCLKEANTSIKNNLIYLSEELSRATQKQTWIEVPKKFASKSLTILHKIVDVMIPIYLETPM